MNNNNILRLILAFLMIIMLINILNEAEAGAIESCEDLNSLSSQQKIVLENSFAYGYDYDLGYTLTAIAYKESGAGLWKINLQDPSAGIYHLSLKSVLVRLNIKDNGFNRNRVAQQLIDDDRFAAKMAIKELLFWRNIHGDNWIKVFSSYNAGYGENMAYAMDIRTTIRTLMQCNFSEYVLAYKEDFLRNFGQ